MSKFNRELYKASKFVERYSGNPDLSFHIMNAAKSNEKSKVKNQKKNK